MDKVIETTELFSLFWKYLEAHCFHCFLDWLPYKTVRKQWKQWASRFFQNSDWKQWK